MQIRIVHDILKLQGCVVVNLASLFVQTVMPSETLLVMYDCQRLMIGLTVNMWHSWNCAVNTQSLSCLHPRVVGVKHGASCP